MKATSPPSSSSLRRGFVFAAALGLLASAGTIVAHAANLVLTGATTASCTYSQATMDASGNLNVVTGTSCGLVPPVPDTLAFSNPPTTVVVNNPVNVTVTRANASSGSVTATLTATGGCNPSSSTVTFGAGINTVTTALTAPASAGSCAVSLTAGAGASLGTPNTFNLTVTAVAALPLDAVAFSSASATVASGGSTTVNVTRATTNYGTVAATIGVSGGCSANPTSVSFSGGATSVPIAVTGLTGPTACTLTLVPGANASAGTITSYSLTVSAPIVTNPGCTTAANTNLDIRTTGRSLIVQGAGQSASVKFYVPGDAKLGGALSTAEYIGATLPPDIQVNISQCPGDFNVVNEACGSYATGHSSTTTYNVGSGPFWNCVVDSTKTWYFNVRFPRCSGTCGVFVDRM